MAERQRKKKSPPSGDEDDNSPKSQTEEPTSLQFLTFTHVDQTTDPETKRRVRSHVMHGVQQKLRGGKGREKGNIPLDISPLSQSYGESSIALAPVPFPHPGTLGSGQSDPFKSYPIEMDVRSHELYDHLHGKTCPMFKTLNRIGFFKTVLDDAAFRQILCTASSHMTHLRHQPQSSEAIVLSSEAIRSINIRISDPVQCLSDGVIITIIAFACHSVMFNDRDGVLTHFNGLEELIRRRGGLQVFSTNIVVRTLIFWIDVNSAFLLDRVPRFPIPYDILPEFNIQPLNSPPDQSLLDACVTEDLASALRELLTFIQYMKNELAIRDLWDDGVFAGLHLVPLVARFLSFRHDDIEFNPALAREESVRIAALMYLGGIRQRFGVQLTSDIFVPKLKQAVVSQDKSNPEQIKNVLLWLLFIGGVQSLRHEDHSFFIGATAGAMMRLKCHTWDELMTTARTVSWVDGALEKECDQFHIELSSELWNTYGHFMP